MIKQTTLENGLRIISHHMSSVESVSFAVYNKVGSRDETKDINDMLGDAKKLHMYARNHQWLVLSMKNGSIINPLSFHLKI